jgi:GntR family transcriptional regulator
VSSPASQLKHQQIAGVLEREIRAGKVPRGHQLPGETSLAERFAVSRNTVRAALSELGRAGLISTHSGKGSYVTFDGRPVNVRLGWARALEEQGVTTHVSVLALDTVSDPALAEELQEASDRFVRIERLRSIVGGPAISYETSRVPATAEFVARATPAAASGSLTRLLTDSGLVPVTGQQWVEVRHLTDTEAQLLSRAPGEAFLWSRCVTRTADGDLVENVESLLDPAHFRLHFQFSAQDS